MMKIQNYQLLVQLNINFICMKLGNWNEGEICQSFRGFAQIHKNFSFLRCCIDAIINCFYPSEKLHKYIIYFISNNKVTFYPWGHRGRDRMVVGFTTTYAINTYHH